MPTNTLTSLAILRVNIEQGRDYLDYLRPFILHVLAEHDIDPITENTVNRCLREQFGLEIPDRTIEIVLKRISKGHSIKREHGGYRTIGDIPESHLVQKQSEAERHINAVLNGLLQFSQGTTNPIDDLEKAVVAICAFLAEFDITCLRAYLRGTAIPQLDMTHQSDVVLVSRYVQHLQQTAPERFDSLLILVQGHMLANALLCPDLQNISQTYKQVEFYLDTPLLLHILGLEGPAKEIASRELIELLGNLGGKASAFSHTFLELQGVLRGVATSLNSPGGHGLIVHEARKRGITRSDLLLLSESLEEELKQVGVTVEVSPLYIEAFQIDEVAFEQMLIDEVSYNNPRAREHDINSVRSVYAIRRNRFVTTIEKAHAIFVTSNTSFAKAAWDFGQKHRSTSNVSSVITNFSLANMAWLKAPLGAPSIPKTQMLAIAYAALQPSTQLLNKYMAEIDRLEAQGKISERDHQVLRSSPLAHDELMSLTLGEDAALSEETVSRTLERVSSEIKREESEKLRLEQEQHDSTRDALTLQQSHYQTIISNLYWRCDRRANILAWIFSVSITAAIVISLFVGSLAGFGWHPWVLAVCVAVLGLVSLVSLLFGSNVKQLHQWVRQKCLTWLLERESNTMGIDVRE